MYEFDLKKTDRKKKHLVNSPMEAAISSIKAQGTAYSHCVTQLMLYTGDKLSSSIFCCLWVCQASVSPDQISTFSNIYRHTSPLLTMYHLISSSTNLYWPSTSQYRHILTQYHQVPLIIHHLMSHAQYTWSSFILHLNNLTKQTFNHIKYKD